MRQAPPEAMLGDGIEELIHPSATSSFVVAIRLRTTLRTTITRWYSPTRYRR